MEGEELINIEDEVKDTEETVEETTSEAAEETTEETTEEVTEETTEESEDKVEGEDKDSTETDAKDKKKEKKFGIKKDKKDQLIEELTDKYKRTFAEFDNFRKRSEKEKSAMYGMGAKDVVEKILPVMDNFERGFATVTDEQKEDPFVKGMELIYNQMVQTLEELGVKEIEAQDKEFNPDFHNAVMHVEDENVGDNIIVEVLQKGYTYKDTVVRHSMVKVAN
ncbi:MAG: nucleotide exchange factor GrpE [Lachnospiraceae bacterium]|nr:nucleotide exchange factor GrpE [Lachnospiraceae bacterium]